MVRHSALDAFAAAAGAAFALSFALAFPLAFAMHGSGTGCRRCSRIGLPIGGGFHVAAAVGECGGDGNRERGGDEGDECFLHGVWK